MSKQRERASDRKHPAQVSAWATGGYRFAACLTVMIGGFQIIAGLAAIFDDKFFRKPSHYAFHLSPMGFGWIHLIIGLAILYTGIALFQGRNWAAVTALTLAILSAMTFFFFIPLYPFWAILIIAMDVWCVWALSTPHVLPNE